MNCGLVFDLARNHNHSNGIGPGTINTRDGVGATRPRSDIDQRKTVAATTIGFGSHGTSLFMVVENALKVWMFA